MKIKPYFVWLIFLGGVLLLLFSSCSVSPPPRAKGIPSEAVWAGGADGGAWILCKQHDQQKDEYCCQVFNESTGEILANGQYTLRKSIWHSDQQKATYHIVQPIPQELDYSGFDGNLIFLKNSLVMVPLAK